MLAHHVHHTQQRYINKQNTFFSGKDHLRPYVGNMLPLSQSQAAGVRGVWDLTQLSPHGNVFT